MIRFACPYLRGEVELSDERREHILEAHPEFGPEVWDYFVQVLADPDEIRSDRRFPRTRLFSRWFEELLNGKILVVAVVTDDIVSGGPVRHWTVTAYPTRRVTQGDIEWSRP